MFIGAAATALRRRSGSAKSTSCGLLRRRRHAPGHRTNRTLARFVSYLDVGLKYLRAWLSDRQDCRTFLPAVTEICLHLVVQILRRRLATVPRSGLRGGDPFRPYETLIAERPFLIFSLRLRKDHLMYEIAIPGAAASPRTSGSPKRKEAAGQARGNRRFPAPSPSAAQTLSSQGAEAAEEANGRDSHAHRTSGPREAR